MTSKDQSPPKPLERVKPDPEPKPEQNPVITAHQRSLRNREAMRKSNLAGCFYCLQVYPVEHIQAWTDGAQTAICPKCGIDSVLGDAAPFPVTDPAFLTAMNAEWFQKTITLQELKAKLSRSRLRSDSKRIKKRGRK